MCKIDKHVITLSNTLMLLISALECQVSGGDTNGEVVDHSVQPYHTPQNKVSDIVTPFALNTMNGVLEVELKNKLR